MPSLLLAFTASLLLTSNTLGFGVAPQYHHVASVGGATASTQYQPQSALFMTEESAEEGEPAEAQGSATEEAPEEDASEGEEEEDAELKALKEEIANLEQDLRTKRRTWMGTQDKAEEYTKTGYARRVAEMENMRRGRSMLASSNKQGAVALTLTQFLPIYDTLDELNTAYSEDDFGKQYGALYTSIKQAFSDLGAVEYAVAAGDSIDKLRMTVLDSEHSDEQPAETVLRVLRPGMELQGNIVRPAEVVASLGVEEEGEPSDENDE
mmetsp:Transcript_21392/g.27657  ORF Transcript_21392/g.27657 Transcript_21392/m.27657 type:complete len:266 (+) Transcript_21392:131-928(+)|eukprot:CAMPEP_0198141090 /NCGR_PEP_ID=MMETSP1443-20131203/4153_1 /TAXON_ID=186043 /ORGANISM="Entomoneis sp., Strain CCMP2396" /LENGTH=265 /DNA_ID=CAMNT_0043803723 /DNA_START=94 /DNA_END=891 /DNA_ORIENTATION=-